MGRPERTREISCRCFQTSLNSRLNSRTFSSGTRERARRGGGRSIARRANLQFYPCARGSRFCSRARGSRFCSRARIQVLFARADPGSVLFTRADPGILCARGSRFSSRARNQGLFTRDNSFTRADTFGVRGFWEPFAWGHSQRACVAYLQKWRLTTSAVIRTILLFELSCSLICISRSRTRKLGH